ncbi:TRAP transporter permease [Stappia indica]|uniref:TRAP transporter permease n=1 Tax=Stappia indica TaxID=538381 RepID=UPI001CD67D88|nr:TRAP transporter fused permease subunit [Stappia indica]MCA1297081.1 TRAP transporter fused permease subunit [Stappia indica]
MTTTGVDAPSTEERNETVAETLRYRTLTGTWRVVLVLATIAAVGVVINQLFNLQFLVGHTLVGSSFLYLLALFILPFIFIVAPASASAPRDRVPLYDVVLALVAAGILLFFNLNSETIVMAGWEYVAPVSAQIVAALFWLLLVEASRRAGGTALGIIVAIFSLYPLVADQVPGPIQGFPQEPETAASFYAFSSESAFGIPMQAFGGLVVGFIIFGAALQATGAGKVFMDLSFAILGTVRGGAAKVSIFSSGLLGSMSGSVITNVLTTGAMSIPAMRKTGFDKEHAAAVEACASTGAVLMPPVMGATAFIMASFLQIPYSDVVIAAIIPSVLYYLALFLQIDAYSARRKLKGIPRADLPRVRDALKEGWHHIFAFALLMWMLLFLKQEAAAPFYATVVLLVVNQIFGKRLNWSAATNLVYDIGRTLVELTAILTGIGLIIGALVVTGLAGTLATDLIVLAGGSAVLMLLMGAVTSFLLGMGMTVTAAYVFLAIILAPGLVSAGLDPLAVHLFILYWGMLSFITPPVALGSFTAASIAGASPMRTGLTSMRLGSIIYFVPFFFVLNPALILKGTPLEIAYILGTAVVGVFFISAGTQRYLVGFGSLGRGVAGLVAQILMLVSGLCLLYPGGVGGVSTQLVLVVAVVAAAVAIALAWAFPERAGSEQAAEGARNA